MKRQKFTEDYEFTVGKNEDWEESGKFGYSVSLPHQCGEWEILGAEEDDENILSTGSYPKLPCSKEFAIQQMELFVLRAQEALKRLKKLT